MSIFDNPTPFSAKGNRIYDRDYTLYQEQSNRSADKSAFTDRVPVGTLRGGEPQMIQRVTTNLLTLATDGSMQVAAFKIPIQEASLPIEKGQVVTDLKTQKSFRIIAFYQKNDDVDLSVTELND
jgi:hypothetical protein